MECRKPTQNEIARHTAIVPKGAVITDIHDGMLGAVVFYVTHPRKSWLDRMIERLRIRK